jgi:uncharacterized protein YeeX (DUF496 family)
MKEKRNDFEEFSEYDKKIIQLASERISDECDTENVIELIEDVIKQEIDDILPNITKKAIQKMIPKIKKALHDRVDEYIEKNAINEEMIGKIAGETIENSLKDIPELHKETSSSASVKRDLHNTKAPLGLLGSALVSGALLFSFFVIGYYFFKKGRNDENGWSDSG